MPISDPTEIAGLALWLDANDLDTLWQDDGVTAADGDGDPVGRWDDKSGNDRHVSQATAGKRPVVKLDVQNGLNVVRFDAGSTQWMASASTQVVGADGTWTAFAVAEAANTTTYKNILDSDIYTTRIAQFLRFNSNDVEAIAFNTAKNNFNDLSGQTHDAEWVILTGVRTTTTVEAFLNGASNGAKATTGTPIATSLPVYVGRYGQLETQLLSGDVGECLIYNSALSSDDQASVYEYLSQKWGISLGIPEHRVTAVTAQTEYKLHGEHRVTTGLTQVEFRVADPAARVTAAIMQVEYVRRAIRQHGMAVQWMQ